MPNNIYIARLCWNSRNWVQPSGDARGEEQTGTYTARQGFGHEEWLFNYQWILDGWKYGYLQPASKSLARLEGAVIDVNLFTIGRRQGWNYVGEIRSCNILPQSVAQVALKEFKRRGWLSQMKQQVHAIGGNVKALEWHSPRDLFNIRFRPSDAVLYDPLIPVEPNDTIRKIKRYMLVPLKGKLTSIAKQWQRRVASTKDNPTGKLTRAGTKPTNIDLAHNQLQNEMASILRAKYGKQAVSLEENFVDIKVTTGDRTIFVEIKSNPSPRFALREALGQLLDYEFLGSCIRQAPSEFVVAGTGELSKQEKAYVAHLQARWSLPLRYICFRSGMKEVDV